MLRLNNFDPSLDSVIYFDNDDEFTIFAIDPTLKMFEYTDANGNVTHGCDWDYSWAYKNAIANGKKFIIKDPNSRIMKNGDLGYRATTKKIENLEPYFEF